MRHEVIRGPHELSTEPAVQAVVVTGAGEHAFSAGRDLSETQADVDASAADSWMDDWEALYNAFRHIEQPVIAALNGVAAGFAFQAALLSHRRAVGQPSPRRDTQLVRERPQSVLKTIQPVLVDS